ncbi:MAG: hypothetical protein J6R98_07350 [Bacteroidaceae bacterium]|nr:hypothetical protein [Bacteroidaceae bacterium]
MEFSVILNWILGGGLITAIISIITLKATVKEANAKAEKAMAEAEALRIDNVEHATRILMENIVKPLTEQLNATIKSLQSVQREVARLRKALSVANSCKHSDNCPVLYKLRDLAKDGGCETGDLFAGHRGQHCIRSNTENSGSGTHVGGEDGDSDGKPP